MLADLVIISLAIASGWFAYKLFTIKSQYSVFAFCAGLFLVSFLIGGIIAPNKNLLFPKIQGKLIDSETMQPVPDALVVISWFNRYFVFPGQGGGSPHKSFLIRSDTRGTFSGPRRYVSLAINLFPFYVRENIVFPLVFHPDYEISATEIDNTGNITIKMKKISSLGQLSDKYEFCQRFDNGSSEEKEFARICKENTDRQRREYIQRPSAAPNQKNTPDQKAVR